MRDTVAWIAGRLCLLRRKVSKTSAVVADQSETTSETNPIVMIGGSTSPTTAARRSNDKPLSRRCRDFGPDNGVLSHDHNGLVRYRDCKDVHTEQRGTSST